MTHTYQHAADAITGPPPSTFTDVYVMLGVALALVIFIELLRRHSRRST